MSEIFEFKEAVLTIHLPQELDHPQSDRNPKRNRQDHEQSLHQKNNI